MIGSESAKGPDNEAKVEDALAVLQQGGIILYPTDTIWGIGCDATDSKAIQRIFNLKKRAEEKSMIILVSDARMIRTYVSDPSSQLLNYLTTATRPTTAIFTCAINLPSNLINPDGSIAIRLVRDLYCNRLISQLGKPVVSTSANISGEPYPQVFNEISPDIKKGVDYIVPYRQRELSKHSPSAIIRLNGDGVVDFIRP